MRVSTQIVGGYLLAVAAAAAVAILSRVHLGAVGADVEEISEEWGEQDLIVASLAAMRDAVERGPGQAPTAEVAQAIARVTASRIAPRVARGEEHEEEEDRIFASLADILRGAERAEPDELARLEREAERLALALWREDRGRVPARLAAIARRQERLRTLNFGVSAGLVLIPVLLLGYLNLRLFRPLGRVQGRVEAIGDLSPSAIRGASAMERLEAAIDGMALAVEERRQRLEREVASRTQQLLHADRLGGLGRIAAAVAHEMNTPLASIGLCIDGLAEGLEKEPRPVEEMRRCLRTAREQIECCTATTRKLLSYAHFRPQEMEEREAAALAREAVDLVASHVHRAGVTVEIEDEGAGCGVQGDAAQLRQVLVNLLLNAIAVSPRGGSVGVAVRREGSDIALRVSDRGGGIAPEDRDRIFNPFFTTKRPGEGTGLGLSIAREIVEAHGGRLALERPGGPGEPTVFCVHLPAPKGPNA